MGKAFYGMVIDFTDMSSKISNKSNNIFMKKIVVLIFFFALNANAQNFEKGSKLFGMDFFASFTKPEKKIDNSTSSFGVSPNYETFLGKNLSFAIKAGASIQNLTGNSGNQTYTIGTYTFNADAGLNMYVFKNEKVNFYFGPRIQHIGARLKENKDLGLSSKNTANAQFFSVAAGGVFNIKENVYFSAKINALNILLARGENGIRSNGNSFEIGNVGGVSIGFKRLIKSKK